MIISTDDFADLKRKAEKKGWVADYSESLRTANLNRVCGLIPEPKHPKLFGIFKPKLKKK